ncbi:MAG TPA: hypothetical protein VEX87_19955 [Skermanella sp.]|jgi:hypothetical protein|nr:hypothetical protein [Skermanella sp.]
MDRLFSDLMLLVGFCMIAGGMLRSARDILIVTNLRSRHGSYRGKPRA